jgi:protein transport protein SEC24
MFVWVGSQVDPSVLVDLFGVDNGSAINADTHALPPLESSHSRQVRVIIDYLRKLRPRFMQLSIVREGLDVQNAMRFSNLLIEDANLDNMSYVDFLCNVHRSIQGNISK